ncbi:MAG: YebC/PmpR family DNA-binding transcriptional regulator [Candidatus Magasanikbacteria bacterium]
MSGHSKWHNIQQRKGKQDAARSNIFSKYSKQIMIAVRQGGGDPNINFSLRLLVDKAKGSGMPKENIERAIKKASGELGDGAQMEEALYEAFGPGGTAILIKSITDNKNRAGSDIRHIVSEYGGNVGGPGSVQWMFGQWGMIEILKSKLSEKNLDMEAFQLSLIEVGAEDFGDVGEMLEIKTKVENLQKVLDKMKDLGLEPDEFGIQWVAKEKLNVGDDARETLEKMFAKLDDHDDVDDYWTNAE